MAKRIIGSTPKADGYRMPAEFEPQDGVWMLWPERNDNWRSGAKPAQETFCQVARAIARFEKVTMCVSAGQYQNARARLPEEIRVVEVSSNDAWVRDCGPTFLVNGQGGLRAVDWTFNAWGGLYDGLYFPWDRDDQVAQKICEMVDVDSYRTEGFVLEGGSIHSDGEGTILATEACLLSRGRNPELSRAEIEQELKNYLGAQKIVWLPRGIYNDETNEHVDNVCAYVGPAEVVLAWTEDENDPQYALSRASLDALEAATDAKGRHFTVHKLPIPAKPICVTEEELQGYAFEEGEDTREAGERLAASYVNFYISNGGIILPQFGDENDAEAVRILGGLFPGRRVYPIPARSILVGGGNIHCVTQQIPRG